MGVVKALVASAVMILAIYGGDASARERGRPPNFIIILADDLGASELSCYGSNQHKTPNLDRLAESGVRVPEEMSIVSRDDDPFLAFLSPVPARYAANPHVMAKALLRPVLERTEGSAVSQRAGWIMPEFVKGESVGSPKGE